MYMDMYVMLRNYILGTDMYLTLCKGQHFMRSRLRLTLYINSHVRYVW